MPISREECIKLIRHGLGSRIILNKNICLFCFTEVTEADIQQRIKDMCGPGHWLGCVSPKDHSGDCIVKS